jgi:hypothetical protein
MEPSERPSAERTALNVFHDLELLYTRQEHGAPRKAAAGRPVMPQAVDGLSSGRTAPETDFGGWRQAFDQTQAGP